MNKTTTFSTTTAEPPSKLMQKLSISTLLIALGLMHSISFASKHPTYIENEARVVIEAEDFVSQHLDEARRWLVFYASEDSTHNYADADSAHSKDASQGGYIEILPDTRTNHHETLIRGENFTNEAGKVAVLSYPVYISTPGKYYVWVRAYSTGTEDNGVHIGLNGEWPSTSQRVQLCDGKHQWTWSSAQRDKDNHCGTPNTISINIQSTGLHNIMVSMREDGFELDQLLLTQDKDFTPQGILKKTVIAEKAALVQKTMLLNIKDYKRILYGIGDFNIENTGNIPYYPHKMESALAINAVNTEYRNKFAHANYIVDAKDAGKLDLTLVTLAETDGESSYIVKVNGNTIGEFTNPETDIDYQEVYFSMKDIELNEGDIIQVSSKAVTNGKIPENGGTAFARGRWRALVMSK